MLLLLILLMRPPVATGVPVHNIHVTYGRMAVEGQTAMCQIRFFRHDLEEVLRRRYGQPELQLAVDPEADALFTRYLNERFVMEVDDVRLEGTVISSGEEDEMWWYNVRFEAPAPIHRISLKNTLLFEHFSDQKNIFKIKHFPSEVSEALYFTRGADTYVIHV